MSRQQDISRASAPPKKNALPKTATTSTPWPRRILPPLLIILAGFVAYHNSFDGAFVLDDIRHIVDNHHIRRLWPPDYLLNAPPKTDVAPRPITNLTLAINYAAGELHVRGYHIVNLLVHLFSALLLFGVLQRTLTQEPLRAHYGTQSTWLALTATLLWTIHPLNTQCVNYVIQRAEGLMALFYLLTLYGAIRSVESTHRWPWTAIAVTACALGMGSKPIMATAPLTILLYDRAFLSGSIMAALRRRPGLYLGLAATWGVLLLVQAHAPNVPESSAGFGYKDVSPLEYLRTQSGALFHYLRLALWPNPLCFDYKWPVARSTSEILFPSLLIIPLLLGTIWTSIRRRPIGFLGIWFFLILAPTSSFIPIADLAFEFRMYLPLAAVTTFIITAGWTLCHRNRTVLRLSLALLAALIGTYTMLTIRRNPIYRDRLLLWQDTVTKRPTNPRAHMSAGKELTDRGNFAEAIPALTQAIALKPDDEWIAHSTLGVALTAAGRHQEALDHHKEALRLNPAGALAHTNMADTLARLGKLDEMIEHTKIALGLSPTDPDIRYNLAYTLMQQGKLEEAIKYYTEAVHLRPSFAEAHCNLGVALNAAGRADEALPHLRRALALLPNNARIHKQLGKALARSGQREEARVHLTKALQLNPSDAEAQHTLASLQ